jgi:hypothetical protein
MTNVELKNAPHVTLTALIKRRKTTLKQFIQDAGVQSYPGLKSLCQILGLKEVDEATYEKAVGRPVVTSQQDGIVVLGALESEPVTAPIEPPVDDKKFNRGSKKNKRKQETQSPPPNWYEAVVEIPDVDE